MPEQLFNYRKAEIDKEIDRNLEGPQYPEIQGSLWEEIRKRTEVDTEVLEKVDIALAKGKKRQQEDMEWEIKDGIVRYKGRIYIPNSFDLRRRILNMYHRTKITGHSGMFKTLEMVMRQFWWSGMVEWVKGYVRGCNVCQMTKNQTNKKPIPNQPITHEQDAQPFEIVSMDFIGELPKSKGYNALLVVVDQGCTKATVLIPCNTTVTAAETAKLYGEHVWKRFGLPRKIISDRGPQFHATFTRELCKQLGIEQNLSTAYHPQTDGQTERVNQEVEQYLRAFCNHRQNDWADLVMYAEFAHNVRYHSSIKCSPFQALHGYEPRKFDIELTKAEITNNPSVDERLVLMAKVRTEINACSRTAAELSRIKDTRMLPQYKEGDLVWLEGKNIRTTHPTAKLAPKRHGPFKIQQMMGPVTARLELPKQWTIHPVFHISLLTKAQTTPEFGKQYTRPPPDLVEGEEEFEVEAIIDSRIHRRKLQYLVKWKGYPQSDNTWEPVGNVQHAEEAVQSFHQNHPDRPGGVQKRPKTGTARKQYVQLRRSSTHHPRHIPFYRTLCILLSQLSSTTGTYPGYITLPLPPGRHRNIKPANNRVGQQLDDGG